MCVVSIGLSATFIKLVLLSLVFLVRLNQNNTNLLHFWRVQIIGVKRSDPAQHKPYMIRQKKVKIAHSSLGNQVIISKVLGATQDTHLAPLNILPAPYLVFKQVNSQYTKRADETLSLHILHQQLSNIWCAWV